MDVIADLLLLAVGLSAGILLALLLDGYGLGRWLEKALAHNRELAAQHLQAARQLQEARREARLLRRSLSESQAQVNSLNAANQKLAGRVIAAATAVRGQQQLLAQARQQQRQRHAEYQAVCERIVRLERALRLQQRQLARMEEERKTQRAALAALRRAAPSRTAAGSNGLQAVRGIGPVYARRLQEAGIHSLADLAGQRVERIAEVVGLTGNNVQKAEAWLDQVSDLLAQREES